MDTASKTLERFFPKSNRSSIARTLHDNYAYLKDQQELWALIKDLAPVRALSTVNSLHGHVLPHKVINDFIMHHYPCEAVIKYHLAKQFIKKNNEVSIFELNIGSSRLDFGRINGSSYAYEIKTEYDRTTRLLKQLEDYTTAIEYINIVAAAKHIPFVLATAPAHCGIISYEIRSGRFIHKQIKPASLNLAIDATAQIRILTSKDITFILKHIKAPSIPSARHEREALLLQLISHQEFNQYFKLALKKKFSNQWAFLQKCFADIQPIDLQAFYARPLPPSLVYHRNSSIV